MPDSKPVSTPPPTPPTPTPAPQSPMPRPVPPADGPGWTEMTKSDKGKRD